MVYEARRRQSSWGTQDRVAWGKTARLGCLYAGSAKARL